MAKLGFDDIDTSQGGIATVPDGYGRIDWDNFYAIPAHQFGDTGFSRGATSGDQVALNGTGDIAKLSVDHGVFTVRSVEMTAAWDTSLKVQIDGYSGSEHSYHRTVILSDAGPQLVKLNFVDVDLVVFYPVPGSGVHDPKQTGSGNVIAFDDMKITDVHAHVAAMREPHFAPIELLYGAGHLAIA